MASNDKHYLTKEGLKKLENELKFLQGDKRKEVAKRLEEAIAMGDLSENAAYDEAKDALEKLEKRIGELKEILKEPEIIDKSGNDSDIVEIGATIVVNGEKGDRTFTIVGRNEVDPLSGKISNESPLGYAFLGKKVGEKVIVKTPKKSVEYKIKKISY